MTVSSSVSRVSIVGCGQAVFVTFATASFGCQIATGNQASTHRFVPAVMQTAGHVITVAECSGAHLPHMVVVFFHVESSA